MQTHADYEHRLQEEVNARLLKEQELQHLVHFASFSAMAPGSSLRLCASVMTSSMQQYLTLNHDPAHIATVLHGPCWIVSGCACD